MSDLKPCPFCGGNDLRLEPSGEREPNEIICWDCLAVFSQMEITCVEDLVEAWNRRALHDER